MRTLRPRPVPIARSAFAGFRTDRAPVYPEVLADLAPVAWLGRRVAVAFDELALAI